MLVVLFRHGIAPTQAEAGVATDAERPLSDEGARRTRQAARGLAAWLATRDDLGGRIDVLASPARRTWETAEIVARALPERPTPRAVRALALDGAAEDVLAEEALARREGVVVLVGHEPSLSALATWLVGGTGLRVELKKAAALAIGFAGPASPSAGTMLALLPPRVLRDLDQDA